MIVIQILTGVIFLYLASIGEGDLYYIAAALSLLAAGLRLAGGRR